MSSKEILVSIALGEENIRIGKLWFYVRGHKESASLATAMRVAKDFRLKKEEALSIIKKVASAVNQWRSVAAEFGLSKRECDKMSSAFARKEN
jgi:serine/threonine-protein kinase HipA